MYRTGHLGVSLLVFAPFGVLLVRAGHPELAYLSGLVMLWLCMLPDVDQRLPGVPHRGPTHSLLFAALVGVVFAAAGAVVGARTGLAYPFGLGAFGFLLGSLTVLAHLLADSLTPAGVNYLWPLSARTYTVSVTRADNAVANYLLLVVGAFGAAVAAVVAFRLPV
jgi:inner membrane protein